MPEAHAARRARLAAKIAESGADAALITHLVNVRYLTGLASSNAALLVTAGASGAAPSTGTARTVSAATTGGTGITARAARARAAPSAVLATDTRYALAAARDCPDVRLITDRDVAASLARFAGRHGLRRILFEAHVMTVEQHTAIAAEAGEPGDEAGDDYDDYAAQGSHAATPGTAAPPGRARTAPDGTRSGPVAAEMGSLEFTPLGRQVEKLRMVKDDQELAAIRQACRLTCEAFDQMLPAIRPGMTERELAVALDRRMVDLGADGPAFATIVASGPNSAFPHHLPGDRPITRGDLVMMDFGACYGGYHADMTRTIAVGAPSRWQQDVYQLVLTAQRAGVEALRPGARVARVDAAARDVISAAGHGDHFGHGLGHGVGLEIHEAPLMHHMGTGTLGDRVPITVEPGVYLEGLGGVRIEDTLVVRSGPEPAELLTTTTKELLVV